MEKHKTLKFDNKTLLIAGIIVILIALIAWGFVAQRQRLHDAPRAVLTPLTIIKELEPARFIPYCDPLREKCETVVNPVIEPIKGLEIDVKKKSYR